MNIIYKFNVGRDVNTHINIYAKLNLLYEFGGAAGIQMANNQRDMVSLDQNYGDTWIEYGISTDIRFSDGRCVYFDIAEGIGGGEFGQHWQWNAGVRWIF